MNLNESLGFLLNKAAGEMKYALETALRPYDLTPAQWSVLASLCQQDRQTISDLGQVLHFDRPTMSGIIRRLSKKALISKIADPEDRRISRISITKAGKDLMQELPLLAKEVNRRALKGFSDSEAVEVKKYLKKILNNMNR